MKLRDLVANSLPRMRNRKKKSSVPGPEGAAAEIVDRKQSRGSHHSSPRRSRDAKFENMGVCEADWRGNALYKAAETGRGGVVGMEMTAAGPGMMTSSCTTSHGIVASHSTEGFSSQLTMMSRSYDSRMAVSEYGDSSSSQMSSLSPIAMLPLPMKQPNQLYYHCHSHRSSHEHHYHHHHHHHHHSQLHQPQQPMRAVPQNQQNRSRCSLCPVEKAGVVKAEPGFFWRSFASFRAMRKHSARAVKDERVVDGMRCSVCPYPETTLDRKATDKQPVKPKRKGLKAFSRSKENKTTFSDNDKYDKSWFSDNDAQIPQSVPRGYDNSGPYHVTSERPRTRECSVESCSSRLFGSRESSCVRDVDLTGFDSGSLSGYESDLPRGGKGYRSRSRIKTNPWLPSPQPSLSCGRRAESFEFRESREDIMFVDDLPTSRTFQRSESFEHNRSNPDSSSAQILASRLDNDARSCGWRPRDTGIQVDTTTITTSSLDRSPKLRASRARAAVVAFNDLNSDTTKSRPTSIVSPSSEFVKLADHLEQLANNISFEYEDMLDSTLESVSFIQEDGQASIQELLTDEESRSSGGGKNAEEVGGATFIQCGEGCDMTSAHSPDSGISGLGGSDGDETAVTSGQAERTLPTPMECSPASPRAYSGMKQGVATKSCNPSAPGKHLLTNHDDSLALNLVVEQRTCDINVEDGLTVWESDIDNTSYQDTPDSEHTPTVGDKKQGSPLLKCKTESSSSRVHTRALMVDECLDTTFQPSHHRHHTGGHGILMGARVSSQENGISEFSLPARVQTSTRVGSADGHINPPVRISRPNDLKTSSWAHETRPAINNMGKCSEYGQIGGRPWSDNFTFPRNITSSECVESPTENWSWEGHCDVSEMRATRDDPAGFTTGENAPPEADSVRKRSGLLKEKKWINNLINATPHPHILQSGISSVRNKRQNGKFGSSTVIGCSENADKYDTEYFESLSASEMADACVQTDFTDDDEYSQWESAQDYTSLDGFETPDVPESTRIWLMTGNMQGSADTGYSSLARDSRVLGEEEPFPSLEPEGLAIGGPGDRASCQETRGQGFGADRAGVRSAPQLTEGGSEKSRAVRLRQSLPSMHPQACGISGGKSPDEFSASSDVVTCTRNSNLSSPGGMDEAGEELKSPRSYDRGKDEQSITTAKSFPPDVVHQMFSNIENQFQEIFQQIHGHRRIMEEKETCTKRSSSIESDSTLKSSCSDPSTFEEDVISCEAITTPRLQDSETGEEKNCSEHEQKDESKQNAEPVYVNVPVVIKCQGSSVRGHSFPCRMAGNDLKISTANLSESLPSSLEADSSSSKDENRADYLEFLRDTPLNRSHLKRPLFLVPGVGPVDMSSSEQINLFSDSQQSLDWESQDRARTRSVPSSSSSSTSPSAKHSGKKFKLKRAGHKVPEEIMSLSYTASPGASSHATPDHQVSSCHDSHQYSNHDSRGQKIVSSATNKNKVNECKPSNTSYGDLHPSNAIVGKADPNKQTQHELVNSLGTKTDDVIASNSLVVENMIGLEEDDGTSSSSVVENRISLNDDDVTRGLAERVRALRREKEKVYRKIREAQHDEMSRQNQRVQLQRNLHVQRKEALLDTLRELKQRLEEQSKKLQMPQE